jgi:RNA polymerase sigma-32 factor
MSTYTNLPAPSPEQGLNRYMQEIRKFPLLEPEEEYMLAKRWVDHQDTEAAHRMVTSHLRSGRQDRHGLSRLWPAAGRGDISEANVGLMQAVKRFDPEKGFRLATYAMWWIRASIQEYILRSWSPGEAGHHIRPEKAVLQSSQGQGQGRRSGGRRPAARECGPDRQGPVA